MDNAILNSPLSKKNVINIESKGSMEPSKSSNDFHCGRHVLITSRVDLTVGDWAKLSMML